MKCSCGGEYRCERCGGKVRQPTARQIQAYLLVHVHGFTQAEAGERMGVMQHTISGHLKALERVRPNLFRGGKGIASTVFFNFF